MSVVLRFCPVRAVDDAVLNDSERVRRDRLVRADDRAAFTAAHRLVRECAARLLGCAVADVDVAQQCAECGASGHGRPFLPAAPRVSLSLSHTRAHVAAVASADGRCGIDVESVHEGPPPGRSLTAREAEWVRLQADPESAFTRLWVRKEALVKAGVARLDHVGDLDVLGPDGPADQIHGMRLSQWTFGSACGAVALG